MEHSLCAKFIGPPKFPSFVDIYCVVHNLVKEWIWSIPMAALFKNASPWFDLIWTFSWAINKKKYDIVDESQKAKNFLWSHDRTFLILTIVCRKAIATELLANLLSRHVYPDQSCDWFKGLQLVKIFVLAATYLISPIISNTYPADCRTIVWSLIMGKLFLTRNPYS